MFRLLEEVENGHKELPGLTLAAPENLQRIERSALIRGTGINCIFVLKCSEVSMPLEGGCSY